MKHLVVLDWGADHTDRADRWDTKVMSNVPRRYTGVGLCYDALAMRLCSEVARHDYDQ